MSIAAIDKYIILFISCLLVFSCADKILKNTEIVYSYISKTGTNTLEREIVYNELTDSIHLLKYKYFDNGNTFIREYRIPLLVDTLKSFEPTNNGNEEVNISIVEKIRVRFFGKEHEIIKYKRDNPFSIDEENYLYYVHKYGLIKIENYNFNNSIDLINCPNCNKEELYFLHKKISELLR